jgi:hypothetical protein
MKCVCACWEDQQLLEQTIRGRGVPGAIQIGQEVKMGTENKYENISSYGFPSLVSL